MTYRNRAKCKNCGDIIESTHQHDFVSCTCFRATSKAMDEYRDAHFIISTKTSTIGGKSFTYNDYDHKAMYADEGYKALQAASHGFFLDGGKGYDGKGGHTRYGGNFHDIIPMTAETVEDNIHRTY